MNDFDDEELSFINEEEALSRQLAANGLHNDEVAELQELSSRIVDWCLDRIAV